MDTLLRALLLAVSVSCTTAKVAKDFIACADIGNASFTEVEGSEYLSVKCNEGFHMEQTLVCEDDKWVYQLPVCKYALCTGNPEIKHGTLNTEITSRYVGAEYEFTCDPVFGSGIVGKVQCNDNLEWEANLACDAEYVRGCFYTNYAQFRSGSYKFLPEDIDPTLCTHIFYAFAKLDGVTPDIGPDKDNDKEMWGRVLALKSLNPKLKVYLTVGGREEASTNFATIVDTDAQIQKFATSVVSLLRTEGFDGLNVDWEYPGSISGGSELGHKQRFTSLLKILREKFSEDSRQSGRPSLDLREKDSEDSSQSGRPSLDLIATVAPSPFVANPAYEHSTIQNYVDFVIVKTYDFAGTRLSKVEHHSALKQDTALDNNWDMERAINYWINKGFPANKIVLGLAAYGRGFEISDGVQTAPGTALVGVGSAGPGLRQAGFLAYPEICILIKSYGWVSEWIETQKVPYAYGEYQSTYNWVGYDTPRSFGEKTEFVKTNGLAGVFVWTLSLDDFTGTACDEGKYPLLNAIVNGFSGSTPPTQPTQPPQPPTPGNQDNSQNK